MTLNDNILPVVAEVKIWLWSSIPIYPLMPISPKLLIELSHGPT